MIVHIVMFKFKDEDKDENILKTKLKLKILINKIDELKFLEVGVNINDKSRAFDLSLYSKFDSIYDLKTYATHKEHLKVVDFIKKVTMESKVVDYEL